MKKSIIYYAEQLSGSPHIFQYIDLDDLKNMMFIQTNNYKRGKSKK